MKLQELSSSIKTPVFFGNDVQKLFSVETKNHINTQLHRMVKRGNLISIKRDMYFFPHTKIDEFVLANKLYMPSYVSLESVLYLSGIITEIPSNVTSITTITSKKLITTSGIYLYSKLNKKLFFGYSSILDTKSDCYYNIANVEKALLDFIYVRRLRNLDGYNINFTFINKDILTDYLIYFPKWVKKVIQNA